MKTPGEIIEFARRTARPKLKIAQLAAKAGISPSTWQRIEGDDPAALPENVAAVLSVLNLKRDPVTKCVLMPTGVTDADVEEIIRTGRRKRRRDVD